MGLKHLLWILVLLVALTSVSASFSVTQDAVYNRIGLEEEASFILTIKNTGHDTENFRIYSPDPEWLFRIHPTSDENFDLPAGIEKKINITVKPTNTIKKGFQYGVLVNIKAKYSDDLRKEYLIVRVRSDEEVNLEYQPTIRTTINAPEHVDPQEEYQLSVTLENLNIRDIGELEVRLDSELIHLNTYTSLGPRKIKTVVFPLSVDRYTPPQDDYFRITSYTEGKIVTSDTIPFEITPFYSFDEDNTYKRGFLKGTETITLTNTGNVKQTETFTLERGFIKRLFTSSNTPHEYVKISGKRYMSFTVDLAPREKATITIITNYQIVFYIFVAALVVLILYYLFRSPLIIKKSVSSITQKEGNISELRILLDVKNRSGHPLDSVIIVDRAPHITEVIQQFSFGVLKPAKILQHEKKGTIVKWRVETFDPYEERVLSYRVKTKLNIIGGLNLPMALAKFKNKKGREVVYRSNSLRIAVKPEQD